MPSRSFSISPATRSTFPAGSTTSPWRWCSPTAASTRSSTPPSTASSRPASDAWRRNRNWINSCVRLPPVCRTNTIVSQRLFFVVTNSCVSDGVLHADISCRQHSRSTSCSCRVTSVRCLVVGPSRWLTPWPGTQFGEIPSSNSGITMLI